MKRSLRPLSLAATACLFAPVPVALFAAEANAARKEATNLGEDADGNPLRRNPRTGHVSNYDEAKVGAYTLPDPLVFQDGRPVRDAQTWMNQRRPEIIALYEHDIYGRVPESAPKTNAELVATDTTLDGAAVRKHIVLHFGAGADAPLADVILYLPAKAGAPVPVLLQLVFMSGLPADDAAAPASHGGRRPSAETGPVADILARGFGYATLRYTEIEGDSAATSLTRVRRLALAPGQEQPAPDKWGAITAWSWGACRVLDYLETDRAVDAKRVAIIGHSRLGKTALWTGARDSRFALVFSSCSGEMGAALARRDFGETVDDMATNFPWQFAGNFQRYIGHWNDMPVDAHMLIALCAPRPVFISGGTKDQWADPRGEFLAEVAAGPVYRLLGKKDLGTKELPPLDAPQSTGDLGWIYHNGGHLITAGDWKAFLDFADRQLRPGK